ncbi:hypothetical protein IWX49DRAFT_321915 [Phyllosticta citricarpa]
MLDQNLRITMYGKIATKSCPSASAPRNFAFRLTALLPLRRKSKNIDVIVARERGAAHACTHVLCFRFLSVCRSIDEGFLPHICFFFLSPLFFFFCFPSSASASASASTRYAAPASEDCTRLEREAPVPVPVPIRRSCLDSGTEGASEPCSLTRVGREACRIGVL